MNLEKVALYYQEKYNEYGSTSKGVDWSSEETHISRMKVIAEVGIQTGDTIFDVGAGYGAFFEYLKDRGKNVFYTGVDLVKSFCEDAKKKGINIINDDFLKLDVEDNSYDWVVANGTFHVKTSIPSKIWWRDFVKPSLIKMFKMAIKGISFNLLPFNVDFKYDRLFYPDPKEFFDLIYMLSEKFLLRQDYNLYEMTIYIYKE